MVAIAASCKSRGRPLTGIGKALGLQLYADVEAALAWIADQAEKIGRPEAIRCILAGRLRADGYLLKGRLRRRSQGGKPLRHG